MQEICDLFSADYDFLVQIVEKLRISCAKIVLPWFMACEVRP